MPPSTVTQPTVHVWYYTWTSCRTIMIEQMCFYRYIYNTGAVRINTNIEVWWLDPLMVNSMHHRYAGMQRLAFCTKKTPNTIDLSLFFTRTWFILTHEYVVANRRTYVWYLHVIPMPRSPVRFLPSRDVFLLIVGNPVIDFLAMAPHAQQC